MSKPQQDEGQWVIWVLVILVVTGIALFLLLRHVERAPRVGVLHSVTGKWAATEAPLVKAVKLAVDEVNAAGGVTGRTLEMVSRDCRSDPVICATLAEEMITSEKVDVLFGCGTSECRKAVGAVVEKHRHVLFYPMPFEGMGQNAHVAHTGSLPNQHLIPAISWALQHLGKHVYIVGTEGSYARIGSRVIRDVLQLKGGQLAGEYYVSPGAQTLAQAVADIRRKRPDVVLNLLWGDSNKALFEALDKAAQGKTSVPVVSLIESDGGKHAVGHFVAMSYFHSLPGGANQVFVQGMRQQAVVPGMAEQNSYAGVKLWASAANEAADTRAERVLRAMAQQSLNSPEGIMVLDDETLSVWKPFRVGKVLPEGQFELLHETGPVLEPKLFPDFRGQEEWRRVLKLGSVE